MILESALASGNNTILHITKNPAMELPQIAHLPFSYYWAPYLAVMKEIPFYCPGGRQAIKSIAHVPKNIPIIIIHSRDDLEISFKDACALYYGLRSQGNNNVYLVEKSGFVHIEILKSDYDKDIIRTILKKHNILNDIEIQYNIDINQFQPDHMQFKELYDDLIFKESMHEHIGSAVLLGTICFLWKLFVS